MASVAKRKWTHNGVTKSAWEVRYRDGGRQRSKSFEMKKDADAYKRQVEREIEDGSHIPSSEDLTIRRVAEEFLAAQAQRTSDGRMGKTTLKNYTIEITKNLIPLWGNRKINGIKTSDVDDYYSKLCKEMRLAPITAKRRIRTVRSVFRFAQRRGYVRNEPVTAALADLRGVATEKIKTFEQEQVMMLLDTALNRSPARRGRTRLFMNCAVNLAAFCGMRYGEIIGLTVDCVDFRNRVIKVRHSLTNLDELKGPKTRSGVRDIPMPQHVYFMLKDYLKRFYVPNDRGLLFRTNLGTIITGTCFHRGYWAPLLKAAGLWNEEDKFHFHALRHFFASWMIFKQVPVTEVASLMGHRTFDTTLQTYAHAIAGGSARSEMMDRLAVDLLPAPGGVIDSVRVIDAS